MLPTVSIILPTYNRARFLSQALESIRGQQWTDWELIIVDDGSTDETAEIIGGLTAGIEQPVKFVQQKNQGAYGARNTGLHHATGKYIAFYDSDDLWLSHHLQDCVDALEANPDVDWVYGACRMVNHATGEEVAPSTFYVNGQRRPFMELKSHAADRLMIIDDPQIVQYQIKHGLFCGLQNSVIRKRVFAEQRIPAFRVGEDQLLTINSLISGFRLAYYDRVHVVYRIHAESTSAGAQSVAGNSERAIHSVADAHASLLDNTDIPRSIRMAVRKRLQEEYFWKLGYATLWMNGRHTEALKMCRLGLRHWPWDWRCWKTYILLSIRHFGKRQS